MSHNHNLSINSITSIIEPTTPPNLASQQHTPTTSSCSTSSTNFQNQKFFSKSGSTKSNIWDTSNKLNHNLNLPNFAIDNEILSTPLVIPPGVGGGATKPGSISSTTSSQTSDRKSSLDPSQQFERGSDLGNSGESFTGSVNKNMISKLNISSDEATPSSSMNSTPPSCTTPSIRIPQKIDKEYLASINKLPLIQLKSEILKLSKDQYGCRFLQKKIDENLIPNYQVRHGNFDIIFKQIYPYMYELIIDPFGNYLIQKLIVYCNESNLNILLEILQENLYQISISQHGTRALQKIIDNLNNSYQLELLTKGLKPYIIDLIKDLNGNHVIQKILNKYQPQDCQFIYDSIIEELYIVATHKHGCCVLQKCLNHVTSRQLEQFSQAILQFNNFKLLINDQFGNYVLQYLISINSFDMNYKIFENFVQFNIGNLCNLKFSSNVVEKFLKNCFNNEGLNISFSNLKFELIYNILINDLNKLINDPYGNYVIQTLIDILINSHVNYAQVEKLSLILPDNQHYQQQELDQNSLQIIIIKYWFQNCKIVSSFGKRIQSKINTILNNNINGTTSSPTTTNFSFSNQQQQNVLNNNKKSQMNSNGEFVVNDLYYRSKPQSVGFRNSSSPVGMSGTHNEQSSSYIYNGQNVNHPSATTTTHQNRNFSLPTNLYANLNNNGNINPGDNNNCNANNNNVTPPHVSGAVFRPPRDSASNTPINMNQQSGFTDYMANEYVFSEKQRHLPPRQHQPPPQQVMPQQHHMAKPMPLDTQYNVNQPPYYPNHKLSMSGYSNASSQTQSHYTTSDMNYSNYNLPPPGPPSSLPQAGAPTGAPPYYNHAQQFPQGNQGPLPPHPPPQQQQQHNHIHQQHYYGNMQNTVHHGHSPSWSGNGPLFGSVAPKW
ncbi:Suppressor protein MPT5 [Spathaspora sp. JA1]|nr:Suppressor protein MPT5 [Spathaspora sp. JA1]